MTQPHAHGQPHHTHSAAIRDYTIITQNHYYMQGVDSSFDCIYMNVKKQTKQKQKSNSYNR